MQDSKALAQRILVTGNAGSGKTRLSRKLARNLNLELIHLDQMVWLPRWEAAAMDERQRRIKEATQKPNWVIDGVSLKTMKAADVIVF
jgi:adenylate kinase family enzyme